MSIKVCKQLYVPACILLYRIHAGTYSWSWSVETLFCIQWCHEGLLKPLSILEKSPIHHRAHTLTFKSKSNLESGVNLHIHDYGLQDKCGVYSENPHTVDMRRLCKPESNLNPSCCDVTVSSTKTTLLFRSYCIICSKECYTYPQNINALYMLLSHITTHTYNRWLLELVSHFYRFK